MPRKLNTTITKSLFTRDKETWTKFKLGKGVSDLYKGLIALIASKVRESRDFIYYEAKGDWLNGKFEVTQ